MKRKLLKYTSHDIHDLLHDKRDQIRGKKYGEFEGYITDQAFICPYYVPLKGNLGMDWGVIVNPMSPNFGMLVFEHEACLCFNHEGIQGNQIGTSWMLKGGEKKNE
jgi:hypothetical protein